jgi:hypothetical protein
VKLRLRFLLVRLHSSDKYGAEIRGRCGCGRTMGHGNRSGCDSEGDRERVASMQADGKYRYRRLFTGTLT